MKSPLGMLPANFLTRLGDILPAEKYHKAANSFYKRRPTTFRANILKISADALKERLENKGINVERINWLRSAFILKNKLLRDLMETAEYKQGLLYVQSLSSMAAPVVLAPQKGEKVLDIAAAPGSKTTQMAAMMENMGEIVANDTSHIRIFKLEANLKMQGVTNVKISRISGQAIWKTYTEYFDKVLVDVPCSGEGRICLSDPKSFAQWSYKKIQILSKMQKWILRSAVSTAKVGGRIVYSTCTLAPEENEEVIDWILEKEKGNLVLEKINIPGLYTDSGLKSWENQVYSKEVVNCARIAPSENMEGFFIASFKKVKSNVKNNYDSDF